MLYLSVISIGELRRGFVILQPGKRRRDLEHWFEMDLTPRFKGRILPITQSVADRWGQLDGVRQLKGAPLSMADGLSAATALEYNMSVATRNVKDFTGPGVSVFNPWEYVHRA